MNLTTAFEKFIERTGHSSLPWQTSRDEMLDIFTSGWLAHAESLKHADDLFPGTLGHLPLGGGEDYTSANVAQLVEQIPCKDKVVGSIPSVGSTPFNPADLPHDHDHLPITAEMIYAAWPVKKARGAAITAIKKAMKKEKPEELLAAVKELAACYANWPATEKQYLPMCSTFMNQERWADDRATWRKGAAATPSQFTKKYE